MLRRTFLLASVPFGMAGAARVRGVSTIAGNGVAGYSGDGGPGAEGQISNPGGLAIGPDFELYFCEVDNHCVRRLSLRSRELSTFAGNLRRGYSGDGGPAIEASLSHPSNLRFDAAGNMFIVDGQNHVVRRVDARTKIITTVAGAGVSGFDGDGGPAAKAHLAQPADLLFDAQGRLLIADAGNNRIRRVDLKTGLIETWLGTGERKPTPDGAPLAGTPLHGPRALSLAEDGHIDLVLQDGNAVFHFDTKVQRYLPITGTGEKGYSGDGGPAKGARIAGARGVATGPDGTLYIADSVNNAIRMVDVKTGLISTVAGTGERGDGPDGDPLRCKLAHPRGVFIGPRGGIFLSDSENHRIRVVR